MVEENKLCTEYVTLMSGIVVEYRAGEKLTTAQIKKYDSNPDRELRKGAYMALGKEMKRNGKKIDDIYDKLVKVRTRMAKVGKPGKLFRAGLSAHDAQLLMTAMI